MKILFLKKSFAIICAALIALATTLGICAHTAALNYNYNSPATIVIDAGHGGIDAGVVGIATKTKESDINLAVARYLKEYFLEAGFVAIMTRNSQAGLYGTPTKGFKSRDMKKRKQIIEESKADMVISIHQNFCPIKSRRGGQVFFNETSQSGKRLAELVQNSLNEMKECVKKNAPLVGDFFMLKCTDSPSVLVECGFLSNPEDEALLVTNEYKKALAYAIFKGAILYF